MENRKRKLLEINRSELEDDVSVIVFENYLRKNESNSNNSTHYCEDTDVMYAIKKEEYSFFLELYGAAITKKEYNLVELSNKVYQATFSFVFEYTNEFEGRPIYFMRSIIAKIFEILKSLFKTELVSNLEDCIVTRTKEPEFNENSMSIYVVQFKNIIIFDAVFKFVRETILEDTGLIEMFDEFNFSNSFSDAFQNNIKTNMVGTKINGEMLEYSRYYIFSDFERNFNENLLEKWGVTKLQNYISIRKGCFSEMMPFSVVGELNLLTTSDLLYGDDEFIYSLVELIDPKKVREEDIMWALLNITSGRDLFPIMRRFSTNISRIYWEQMSSNINPEKKHLGLSTLLYFSSIHSENVFKLWFFENIWLFIRIACDKYISFYLENDDETNDEDCNQVDEDCNQVDVKVNINSFESVCYYIAIISKLLYSNRFVCTDIGRKNWFHFNGINWVECNKGVNLSKLFDTNLYSIFHYWSVKFMKESVVDAVKVKRNYYAKCCSDFAAFVRNPLKKKILLNVCAEHFYWDFHHILNQTLKCANFEENLDTNKYLIGCRNGVYDLSLDTFRDAKPDDFISLSTEIFYSEYGWDHPCVIEINSFMRKLFPNQMILSYVMKLFASFLDGDIEEQFYIFTGNGSNGKSKLVELFQLSFGEYVGTLPVSLITGKRTPSSNATPELVRMKGKRLGVMHESNVSDTINLGLIKAISGGDKMYARALHSEPIEFRPTFQLLLLCNDKPKKIDPYDYAMWRRIIVVNFNNSFVDNPDPEDDTQFKKDNTIHKKIILWKEAFLWMLLQYYIELKSQGNVIPEEVLYDTEQYRKSNDFVTIFLKKCVVVTNCSSDVISANDLFTKFKVFFYEYYQEKNRLKYDDFIEIAALNLGDVVTVETNKKGWTNIVFI